MLAALGFVVLAFVCLILWGYGVITPDHPYRVGRGPRQRALSRRLSVCCWVGGLGFVVSLIMVGRFLPWE
jgi:hypothetical protein